MEIKEREQLYVFVMSLEDMFNTIKMQILKTRPISSLERAYHFVAEDEQWTEH